MCDLCRAAILSNTSNWGAYCSNPGTTSCGIPPSNGRNVLFLVKKGRRSVPSLFSLCKDVISRTKLWDSIARDYLDTLDNPIDAIKIEAPQFENLSHGDFPPFCPHPLGTQIFPLAIPDAEFASHASKYFHAKFPQFPSPFAFQILTVPGTNLHEPNNILSDCFDLYWLVTDMIGMEFFCPDRYKKFWSSVHKSHGDCLAWCSKKFSILDTAAHLWNGLEAAEGIDAREPVYYTNMNGFYQHCILSKDFLGELTEQEQHHIGMFINESTDLQRLVRSNNALFPLEVDHERNVALLDSGKFFDHLKFDSNVKKCRKALVNCMLSAAWPAENCIGGDWEWEWEGHHYKSSYIKVIDFYPNSAVAYGGHVCLIIEHFVGREKMGEVYLSKKMFQELMENWDANMTETEGGSWGEQQYLHNHGPPYSSNETLYSHCRSKSIINKDAGLHPFFDLDPDRSSPLF